MTDTTKPIDPALAEAIATHEAPAQRKTVAEALRDVALINATEGRRDAAAWLELANVLGAGLDIEPIAQRAPAALTAPLVELPGGNAALQGPSTGVGRRASGSTQIAAPIASTGGVRVQTGAKTSRR